MPIWARGRREVSQSFAALVWRQMKKARAAYVAPVTVSRLPYLAIRGHRRTVKENKNKEQLTN